MEWGGPSHIPKGRNEVQVTPGGHGCWHYLKELWNLVVLPLCGAGVFVTRQVGQCLGWWPSPGDQWMCVPASCWSLASGAHHVPSPRLLVGWEPQAQW